MIDGGLDHRVGHARAFFSMLQALAIAQPACGMEKNALAWPVNPMHPVETMIVAIDGCIKDF